MNVSPSQPNVCVSHANRHIFIDFESETFVSKVYPYAGLSENDHDLGMYTHLSVRCLKEYSQTFTGWFIKSKLQDDIF